MTDDQMHTSLYVLSESMMIDVYLDAMMSGALTVLCSLDDDESREKFERNKATANGLAFSVARDPLAREQLLASIKDRIQGTPRDRSLSVEPVQGDES